MIKRFNLFEEEIYKAETDMLLNEGVFSFLSTAIKNFLSRKFGGSIAKIDSVIKRYKEAEQDYWTRWAKARSDMNKADVLGDQAEYGSVERSEQEEIVERNKKLLDQIDDSRRDTLSALQKQAESYAKGNDRLEEYYELAKAKADEEVAKANYTMMKSIADPKTVSAIYKRVGSASDEYKKKKKEFNRSYSSIGFNDDSYMPNNTSSNKRDEYKFTVADKLGIYDDDNEIKMSLDEFKDAYPEDNAEAKKTLEYLKTKYKTAIQKKAQTIKSFKDRATYSKNHSDKKKLADASKKFDEQATKILEALNRKISYLERMKLNQSGESTKQEVTTQAQASTPTAAPATPAPTGQFTLNRANVMARAGEPLNDQAFTALSTDLSGIYDMIPSRFKQDITEEKRLKSVLTDFSRNVFSRKKRKNATETPMSKADIAEVYKELTDEYPRYKQ